MTAQVLPRVETLACTIVEGNGHETEASLPIHTTKRGRRWIAASPVKMEQHGTFYIYALFLDPAQLKPDEDGMFHYAAPLRRSDAVPYFDLDEV